jgi:hypothetical protein
LHEDIFEPGNYRPTKKIKKFESFDAAMQKAYIRKLGQAA